MNTLLVQSLSGNWCIYYRDVNKIPHSVLYYARCVYNNDDKTWIKNIQYSKLPDDLSSLPVAEHLLSPFGKFVDGLIFGDDYVGKQHCYGTAKNKMEKGWQELKDKLSF